MSGDAMQVKIWGCVDIWIDGIRIYRCGTSEMKNVGYDSAFLVRMREGGEEACGSTLLWAI